MNMIPYIRKKQILEEIEKKEIVYVNDLAKIFTGISNSTIRRDLKLLADEGEITLLRGGAVKLNNTSGDVPFKTKQYINVEAKKRIAEFAASLVEEGDVIYIDSGSTALYMVDYLHNKEITIVTSNTQVLNEFNDSKSVCIILGGEFTKSLASISGPITDQLLSGMFFNKAFIGASGYSIQGGINTHDIKESQKKKIVKANSEKVYVLVDSSKAHKNSFSKVFEITDCTVITDKANDITENYSNFIVV